MHPCLHPILAKTWYPPTSIQSRHPPAPDRAHERRSPFGSQVEPHLSTAGFGKTTLATEWVAGRGEPVAWLSLDEGDSDPTRFLTYLVAALQTVQTLAADIGAGVLDVLQSPQPPSIASILTPC